MDFLEKDDFSNLTEVVQRDALSACSLWRLEGTALPVVRVNESSEPKFDQKLCDEETMGTAKKVFLIGMVSVICLKDGGDLRISKVTEIMIV